LRRRSGTSQLPSHSIRGVTYRNQDHLPMAGSGGTCYRLGASADEDKLPIPSLQEGPLAPKSLAPRPSLDRPSQQEIS
jgi:hypothetical protein